MTARLAPLPPPTNSQKLSVVPLPRPVILIGRHPHCDTQILLPQISRRHCCVVQVDRRWLIRDLGGKHGVHVNGRRVEESDLRHNDEVAIASLLFRFEDPTSDVNPSTAPPTAELAPDDDGLVALDI